MPVQKKLVVVGDGACGKTSLLLAFAKDIFHSDYVPTIFETYVTDITVDGVTIELSLWDTSGEEDYDRLRPIQYPETDVILICFSVVWQDTLENVAAKWYPEVKHFCRSVPILLIGTKQDLREDEEEIMKLKTLRKRPVLPQEAERMAKKIGAVTYIECSSKTKKNVQKVFIEAVRAILNQKRKPKKKRCTFI